MKRSETACHRRRRWPSAPLPLPLPLLFLLSLSAPLALAGLPGASLVSGARRRLNLGSMFGSSTAAPSYERIAGQPCFTVTTAWGSPYLIFERVPEDEAGAAADDDDEPADFGAAAAPRQDARQVVLYFMDPDDAECHRDEMQQIDAMKGADMRVMVMSLGKAVRQASNVGKGLPTGQPIDPLTGAMKSPDEGGVLRYKIVPPKRKILEDISLSFFPGAKIGVLGLNGSGKSTLLRIMAGEDTEIEGEARPQHQIRLRPLRLLWPSTKAFKDVCLLSVYYPCRQQEEGRKDGVRERERERKRALVCLCAFLLYPEPCSKHGKFFKRNEMERRTSW